MKRIQGEVQIEFKVEAEVPDNASLDDCETAIGEEARRQADRLSADITTVRLTDVEDVRDEIEAELDEN